MKESSPADTISIVVDETFELAASGAEMAVTVKGARYFAGDAALTKAEEVRLLADDLKKCGLKDEDIQLASVTAESASGLLTKSSSVTYNLLIRCNDLAQVGDVMGAITGSKNGKLEDLHWTFAAEAEVRRAAVRAATSQALAMAREISESLGVTLEGVQSLEPKWPDSDSRTRPRELLWGANPDSPARKKAMGIDLGFSLAHRTRQKLSLHVRFRVSPISGHRS